MKSRLIPKGRYRYFWIVMGSALLLSLLFWLIDGLLQYFYFHEYFLEIIIFEKPRTLLDALLLNVSGYTLFVRLSILLISLAGGFAVSIYMARQEESEKRYRTLFNDAPTAMFTTTWDGKILESNTVFREVLGYTEDELRDLTLEEIYANVQEYGTFTGYLETSGRINGYKTRFQRKDSTFYWVNLTVTPLLSGKKVFLLFIAPDITTQVETEEALRASEAQLRMALNSVRMGIWEWNVEANQLFWSTDLERMFGLEIGAFEGTYEAYLRFIHPEDREFVTKAVKDALEDTMTGEKYRVEHRFVRPDGEVRWTETRGNVIRDAERQPLRMLGTGVDITDRKRAEISLQHKSRQQEQLLDAAHYLTASLNFDEVLLRIARDAQKILEASGTTLYLLEEQDSLLVPQVSLDRQELTAPSSPVSVEQSLAGKAVRTRHSQIFNNIDVQSAVQGTPHGDSQQKHVIVAPFTINEEVLGVLRLTRNTRPFHEEDLALANAFVTLATTALKNAQIHQEQLQAETELREERARLAERVAERTAELRAANAELTRAVHAKDEFLATMSHELRTPLTAILTFAQMLKQGIYGMLNTRQLNAVNGIVSGGEHLLELITDILDVAKIEAGAMELDIALISVEDVSRASLGLIRESAQRKRLSISTRFDGDAPLVKADERRLKQILVNLLSNAVKFTPEGGEIGLEVVGDQEAGVVRFTVLDSGIGIAEEDLPRLFQPFVQLDAGLAREYEGSGLGLALVYRMAEMHGGSVLVQSKLGSGSRFTVALPWNPSECALPILDDTYYAAETEHPRVVLDTLPEDAPTVLLVDDNEAALTSGADYLRSVGYRVLTARDGQEALKVIHATPPQAILMDIQMPGMNGLEAIRRIRSNGWLPEVPIIALTALAMPGDRERCLEMGADAYLSKPLDLHKLLDTLQSLLSSKAH